MKAPEFQAWLPKANLMIKITKLEWSEDSVEVEGDTLEVTPEQEAQPEAFDYDPTAKSWTKVTYKEKPILREFTGALDKDGNEMFQHDIIENPKYGRGVIVWSDHNYCWMVMWSPNSIEPLQTLLPVDCANHKKIGNIFQNGDLVK